MTTPTLFRVFVLYISAIYITRAFNGFDTTNLFPRPGCDRTSFSKLFIYGTDVTLDLNEAPFFIPDEGNDWFQKDILDRSDQEIVAFKASGLDYFRNRLEWDFSESNTDVEVVKDGAEWILWNPQRTGGARLIYGHINPSWGYRPILVSGERVPDICGAVWDGGYHIVTFGEGILARGTWGGSEGRHVPENSLLFFGDYLFVLGRGRRPIQISYIPNRPGIPDDEGFYAIRCNSTSEEYGEGVIAINMIVSPPEDGFQTFSVRSYQSFPRRMACGERPRNAKCRPKPRRRYPFDDYYYGHRRSYRSHASTRPRYESDERFNDYDYGSARNEDLWY